MIEALAALALGALFGAGLALSGMADPAVVLGFLDVAGAWNPALLAVMGGALVVSFPGFRIALRRARPVLAERFHLPTATVLDARLLGGAALFGLGWGLAGYCPGPALVSLVGGSAGAFLFVAAMIAGLAVARALRPVSPG